MGRTQSRQLWVESGHDPTRPGLRLARGHERRTFNARAVEMQHSFAALSALDRLENSPDDYGNAGKFIANEGGFDDAVYPCIGGRIERSAQAKLPAAPATVDVPTGRP